MKENIKIDIENYEEQRKQEIIKNGEYLKVEIIVPVTQKIEEDDRPIIQFRKCSENATSYECALLCMALDDIKDIFITKSNKVKKCYIEMKNIAKRNEEE